MRTERRPRVSLIEGGPGPTSMMARAYAATVAGLLFRTNLRWLFVPLPVLVVLPPPVLAYRDGASAAVVVQVLALCVLALAPAFVVVVELTTILWAAAYMVRRATRPSIVCIATRGWSTAAVWAERDRATGCTYIRLWASFPGHVGGAAARRFLQYADMNGLTVTAHARTDCLADRYLRAGFEHTGQTCMGGRPLLLRAPREPVGASPESGGGALVRVVAQ